MWKSSSYGASQIIAEHNSELAQSMIIGVVGGLAIGAFTSSLQSRSRWPGSLSLAVTLPPLFSLAFLRKVFALSTLCVVTGVYEVLLGPQYHLARIENLSPALKAYIRSASTAISSLDDSSALAVAVGCIVSSVLASIELGSCVALALGTLSASPAPFTGKPGTRGSDTQLTSSCSSSFTSEDVAPVAYTRMKAAMEKSTGDRHGAKVVMREAMLDVFDLVIEDAVSTLKERHELPKVCVFSFCSEKKPEPCHPTHLL